MINIAKILQKNSIKVNFQVIISPIDNLFFSVESFIRGIDTETGELVPPNILFKEAYKEGLTNDLDKVCIKEIFKTFKPISVLNPRTMLHINISKSFIPEASDSEYLILCAKEVNLNPKRIVIDINNIHLDPESIELTNIFIKNHRESGFYISIDDIGRDYSNIDKMMVYNPDIIKINHQMLNNLTNTNYQTNLIQTITKIAHEMGILVISTGIETKDHLVDAIKSGAQLLQGFYLSPTADLNYSKIKEITDNFDRDMAFDILSSKDNINERNVIVNVVSFNTELRNNLKDFEVTLIDSYAKETLSKYSFIESGYLLNHLGLQVTNTYINKENFGSRNKELFGLYGIGFDHSDEETFYRLDSPMLTDWTIKPFYSRLTNALCVTGSFKVGNLEKPYIVVITFDYNEFASYLSKIEPVKHISVLS